MTYLLIYLTGHLILATPLPDMDTCNQIMSGYNHYMEEQNLGDATKPICEDRETPPQVGEAMRERI